MLSQFQVILSCIDFKGIRKAWTQEQSGCSELLDTHMDRGLCNPPLLFYFALYFLSLCCKIYLCWELYALTRDLLGCSPHSTQNMVCAAYMTLLSTAEVDEPGRGVTLAWPRSQGMNGRGKIGAYVS